MHSWQYKIILILLKLIMLPIVNAGVDYGLNITKFIEYRHTRSLIYQGGGVLRLAVGPVFPVDLGDPINWRNFVTLYNLQGGDYSLPTTPTYIWDKWEDIFTRSLSNFESTSDTSKEPQGDDTRLLMYIILEKFISAQPNGGRTCLLRSICENAQVDHHVGILSEVLNIILTPGKEKIDQIYREAFEMGKSNANCLQFYAECPKHKNILEQFLDFL